MLRKGTVKHLQSRMAGTSVCLILAVRVRSQFRGCSRRSCEDWHTEETRIAAWARSAASRTSYQSVTYRGRRAVFGPVAADLIRVRRSRALQGTEATLGVREFQRSGTGAMSGRGTMEPPSGAERSAAGAAAFILRRPRMNRQRREWSGQFTITNLGADMSAGESREFDRGEPPQLQDRRPEPGSVR